MLLSATYVDFFKQSDLNDAMSLLRQLFWLLIFMKAGMPSFFVAKIHN